MTSTEANRLLRTIRRTMGLCRDCGEPGAVKYARCLRCRRLAAARTKAYLDRRRQEARG